MKKRTINWTAVLAGLWVFLSLAGCSGGTAKKTADADQQWAEYVSGHTSGLVSKETKIRILFVNDVVSEEKACKSDAVILAITPKVEGTAVFATRRELIFTPAEQLTSGQRYQVAVQTDKLQGIPENLGLYQFDFQVIKQDFEINVAGLVTSPSDDDTLVLQGTMNTADRENDDLIEQLLTASYLNQPLAIDWQHNADGRNHAFSMSGIKRQKNKALVKLQWDGKAIGVASSGHHEVEVPALGVFKVVTIKTVQTDRQYIQIEFSDSINPSQNLRGLVQASKSGYSLRVERNLVKIYPDDNWLGEVTVTVNDGIRNSKGIRLGDPVTNTVSFVSQKPQVRFAGKGVILPENDILSIPIETINVDAVQVTAFLVFEKNIGRFLQDNKLDGNQELNRVGRYLWRKTIPLGLPEANKWNRFNLDATELLKTNSGGLFRLELSINRGNSTYTCSEEDRNVPVLKEKPFSNAEDLKLNEGSGWDFAEDYFGDSYQTAWRDRQDPCKDAYFAFDAGARASRNFLASNIGLLAKKGSGDQVDIIATNIRTSDPLAGVRIDLMNFQDQKIGEVNTDKDGFATATPAGTPFYLVARTGGQVGYLKMNNGSALPVSHFDVGGQKVEQGIKGYIYGERGVWRPGDDIYLTFVLQDKNDRIPANHPVTMQLFNPKGQLTQSRVNNKPVGDFYTFTLKTPEDGLTGNWKAKALVGGSTFSKTLKIETVVPNRLKVELEFGTEALHRAAMPFTGKLFGQWLHGATAAGLKTDVAVRLHSVPTKFERSSDFVFDDPARELQGEREVIFEGKLDATGHVEFKKDLLPGSEAPGLLSASFTSRVFEEGGAFSTSQTSIPYYPYENFVGIKVPKGDQTRGMLLTDIKHPVEIASLDSHGKPVSLKKVQMTLYKIEWKWWWDNSGESLAQYASASHTSKLLQETISTVDGRGKWEFEVKYPDWGRYMIRACDEEGKHCTGKVFYVDWPGWAGRAQEEGGAGANMLSFTADKKEYSVGETATIRLPEATQGRALISIESGSTVLSQRWLVFDGGKMSFNLPLTREMSPNVYVHVTLLQPHKDKKNDRPIRLYGVIPIRVNDPQTRIEPVIKADDIWEPNSRVQVAISEKNGRPMTYTLALVDEGLLGLTGFRTPELHDHFYKREALGVTTWDLFDYVAGAYGGELERLLALGGDGDLENQANKSPEKRRFPPVVTFMGPFQLQAKASQNHDIELPQYIGAVRLMVVAGADTAYGSADKSVIVRQSLSILPTMPRVLGPEEEVKVPVSVFVTDPAIKEVKLRVEADEHFTVVGSDTVTIAFDKPGEKLGFFTLKVKPTTGKGMARFRAVSGDFKTEAEINLDIRPPNTRTVRLVRKVINPGDEWLEKVVPHGIANTNAVKLELSSVPPINLDSRLQYLIRYPHGCVEQVTSSVFPQLYLGQLVRLDSKQQEEIEKNINEGIARLRQFQNAAGGFMYWPGGGALNAWATNYAGHFLLEAEKAGYHVPQEMMAPWLAYQANSARNWVAGTGRSELDQAYRLYTLSLANTADLGAMNRLREATTLSSVARWQLAAAYSLAGLPDAAKDLVAGDKFTISDYTTEGDTFGSKLRDQAMILNSLVLMGRRQQADNLVEKISTALAAETWHSTQSVAHALMAMARYTGSGSAGSVFGFEYRVGSGVMAGMESKSPILITELKDFPIAGENVKVRNTSDRVLYGSIAIEGVPAAGSEISSSSGLNLDVTYRDMKGNPVEVANLVQSGDFQANVQIRNTTQRLLENIALSFVVPSGWEIRNTRFEEDNDLAGVGLDYQDFRDDRVNTYFGLQSGEEKTIIILLNPAYLGRYYLPTVSAEAMYDATQHARSKGQWVEVVKTRQ